MKGKEIKECRLLPFKVSRSNEESLIKQIVDGVRAAIEGGFYSPGDHLPTTREMAVMLGVSRIVVEHAFSRLKSCNLVSARPHAGVVVLDSGVKLWHGSVLLITTSHSGSYYPNVFAGEIKGRLLNAGYLCMQVSVDSFSPGQPDLSALKAYLRGPVGLAVVLFSSPKIEECLSHSGVPFMVIGEDRKRLRKGCCGNVVLNWNAAIPAFVRHCQTARVKSVLQMSVRKRETVDACAALSEAGISCERLFVREPKERLKPQNIESEAYVALGKRIRSKRSLPELIFFADDHLASGGLWALSDAHMPVPDGVRVVSWSNRGDAPAYSKPITVMEMDARKHASFVAKLVLGWFARKKMSVKVGIGPDYVIGRTFA